MNERSAPQKAPVDFPRVSVSGLVTETDSHILMTRASPPSWGFCGELRATSPFHCFRHQTKLTSRFIQGLERCSAVKRTWGSSRGPELFCQQKHCGFPVPENLVPSLGMNGYCMQVMHIHVYRWNIHTKVFLKTLWGATSFSKSYTFFCLTSWYECGTSSMLIVNESMCSTLSLNLFWSGVYFSNVNVSFQGPLDLPMARKWNKNMVFTKMGQNISKEKR